MIRSGDYKLLASGSFDDIRLYNIKADPTELVDLANSPEHQMIKRELIKILCNDVLFFNPTRPYREEEAKVVFSGNAEDLTLRRNDIRTWHREKTGIEPD